MTLRTYQDGGSYFFALRNPADRDVLISRPYDEETARDADAKWALANVAEEDFYRIRSRGSGQVLELRDEAGSVIATSPEYTDRAALNQAFGFSGTSAEGVAYQGRGMDDDYKPLSFYQDNGGDTRDGFDTFEQSGEHFFSYRVGGVILLISEAYTSARSRDNGTDSVTRNLPVPERYQRRTHPNGNHYFNLLAGNRQEIATSVWFRTAGEVENAIRILLAGGRGGTVTTEVVAANRSANIAIAAAAATNEPPKKKKKRKKRTAPKPKAEKVYLTNGNYRFNDLTYQVFRSGNGKHYFTFKNKEGKTILLNANVRGFETQAEAQAAVDRIMAVGPYERNFEGKTTKNGKYYYYLKDEDGKNIGKSFFFNSTEEMQASVGLFLGSEIATATFEEGKAAGAAAGVAALADTDRGGQATGTVETTAESIKTNNRNVDEYLDCAAYRGHERSVQFPDFSYFQHDGEYYFAMLDKDDEVLLRSEGYPNTRSRENGVKSVIKNRDLEKRWSTIEEDGKYLAILKAGNHQEIGRSCPKAERGAVAGYWRGLGLASAAALGAVGTAGATTPAPVADLSADPPAADATPVVPVEPPVEIPPVDPTPPAAEPEPEDTSVAGLGAAGAAALGAAAAGGMDKTPSPTPDPVPPPPLTAPTPPPPPVEPVRQEKDDTTLAGAAAAGAALAGAALGAAGAKAAGAAATPKRVAGAAGTTTTATGTTKAAAASGGRSGLAWLLLLLPLLLFLLWWQGCFNSNAAAVAPDVDGDAAAMTDDVEGATDGDLNADGSADPVVDPSAAAAAAGTDGDTDTDGNGAMDADADLNAEDVPPPPPPVEEETTPVAPPPPPPPAPATTAAVGATTCATCDANRRIFRFAGSPRSVDRLGTLPEFGDSHGLTPAQFYDKLARRYGADDMDRAYLDYLYRSMGYAGFSAADASQFSDVVIPAGTTGNLGFAAYHGYGHYTLNTSERDRQAFRIQAANGCDVHFMKTCGNYFYFCPR